MVAQAREATRTKRVMLAMLADKRSAAGAGDVECLPTVITIPFEYDHIIWGPIEFVLRNTRREEIRIVELTTSCGCVSAKVGKQVLAPRESTIIRVHIKTEGIEQIDKVQGDYVSVAWKENCKGGAGGLALGLIKQLAQLRRPK